MSGLLWIFWSWFSYYFEDSIILAANNAKAANQDDCLQLFKMIEVALK